MAINLLKLDFLLSPKVLIFSRLSKLSINKTSEK